MQHAREGDGLSAAAWNELVDSARATDEQRTELGGHAGQNAHHGQRTIIEVKNDSGDDRSQFDVLGIDGPLFEFDSNTFKQFPRLKGVEPDEDDHAAKFAILQEPIRDGAIARAVVAGVTICRVDMQAEGHGWADVADEECGHLESRADSGGAQILAVDEGTGVKMAVVRLGVPVASLRHFELKDDLTPGGTADAYPLDDEGEPIVEGHDDWDEETTVFEVVDVLGTLRGRAREKYDNPQHRGSRGIAYWGKYYDDDDEEQQGWCIQDIEPHALMIRGQCTAYVKRTDIWFDIEGVQVMQPTGALITDQAALKLNAGKAAIHNSLLWERSSGEEVFAVWDESGEHWKAAIESNDRIRWFELKNDLVPGGSAGAYSLNLSGNPITNDASTEITVYDALGQFMGRAKDKFSSPHNQGSRGVARWCNYFKKWHVEKLTPHALMIRGIATDDVAEGDDTFDIEEVRILFPTGAIICDHDPGEDTTVENIFKHAIDEGYPAQANWNQQSGEWDSVQSACPEEP